MSTATATANHTPNAKDERKDTAKPTDTTQAKPVQAATAPAAVDQDEDGQDPADRLTAVGKMIRILGKFGKEDRKAIVASLGELTK